MSLAYFLVKVKTVTNIKTVYVPMYVACVEPPVSLYGNTQTFLQPDLKVFKYFDLSLFYPAYFFFHSYLSYLLFSS